MEEIVVSLNSWKDFWEVFRLPIIMSLIGAVIGHYRTNGVIQLPIIVIKYKKGTYLEGVGLRDLRIVVRVLYLFIHFLMFIIGFRKDREEEAPIYIDLGFLGDMMIGIGTGILAKCALALSNTTNEYAIISSSLLAGFAGLSYIQSSQKQDLDKPLTPVDSPVSNNIDMVDGYNETAVGSEQK